MTNSSTSNDAALSANKQALLKIRQLKQQLADARRDLTGEIAIVSMACRFPRHSRCPEEFWENLLLGTDQVSEIPGDRWDLDAFFDQDPDVPGKMYARHGVFLDHLDLMDPEFFGISPREATWVDPQQRLLLEVGWEALERAGWPPDQIGEGTGIFVGWMHNDYQNEASDSFLNLNPYIATGAAGSFLCGRLAYHLGLQGPSVAIDTACSSSLVALHLACQSLHRRECERALVGGVNAIVSPTTNILTCKLQALSPSGHSRAFDAAADGYLRGEGCGVVTLRRLADARRDGDPVIGVIRGSSVGHNGFSSGLTAPNPRAQERVIRQALERAGIDPGDVGYLEAHGTGTELGDPIEMQAAAAALGSGRDPQHPLLVGSVKTNIGHLEAAAGMAGLIKVLLALEHDTIPAQRNFDVPNPHIPWDQIPVQIVVQPTPWPNRQRRIAGVSAFGMSGTNAHVVIESPRREADDAARIPAAATHPATGNEPGPTRRLLVLSGKTDAAVRELAGRYRDWLATHPDACLADVAYTAGVGRRHFEHRAALVMETGRQSRNLLDRLERSGAGPGLFTGQARLTPRVAWQFTGQGAQYVGMARELYAAQPVFRAALDECDARLRPVRQRSLLEVMWQDAEQLNDTRWTQPAMFAIQMGLVRLLESWGLKPDMVLGHSVGQYAAACVAGIISWSDGLHLISERGRLIADLPPGGAMIAIFAPVPEIQAALASHPGVSLAAANGTHTVVSGPQLAVESVASQFSQRGVRCKRLATSHAFHSQLMEPALEPFREIADRVEYSPARLPLICNMTGEPLPADRILDGDYWCRHIRESVRYADSIRAVGEPGCDVLLEIGPQSVLTGMATATWPGQPEGLISCLRKGEQDLPSLMSAIGQLYVRGVTPDFQAMDLRPDRRRIVLPTYPFQRRRFWGPDKPRAWHAAFHTAHPLLGGPCALAGLPGERRYESRVAPDQPPWLPDHDVMGQVVVPGAALVEMALAAAAPGNLSQLVFEQPLRPAGRTVVQTIVRQGAGEGQSIEIWSSPEGESNWTRNFQAAVAPPGSERPAAVDRQALAHSCPETETPGRFYETLREFGLNYGPEFQTIQSIQYSTNDILVRLKSNSDLRGFAIPPTILDGAFHSLAVGLLQDNEGSLFLPVGLDGMECFRESGNEIWCHARWTRPDGQVRSADLTLFDDAGQVVARVRHLKVRQLNRTALRQMAGSGPQRMMYELQWQNFRLPSANSEKRNWLVIGPASPGAKSGSVIPGPAVCLQQSLIEHGHPAIRIDLPDDDRASGGGDNVYRLTAVDAGHWISLLERIRNEHPDFTLQGIIWWMADGDAEGDTRRNCSGLLGLIAALHQQSVRRLECGLQLITRNGVGVPPDHDAGGGDVDPDQAQYWGLGRVVGAEQPEFRCRLIDLEAAADDSATPDSSETPAAALLEIILNETHENQFAIRGHHILVCRLVPVPRPRGDVSRPGFQVRPDASYLITGGLGMLGRQAARWLAHQGAGHLVLVSRRPPNESARSLIEEIENSGCQVSVHLADLASREDVQRLFARFDNDLPDLAGVIHAAGVLDDGLLVDQTWERFEKVMAPKVAGARLLDEFTATRPLDFFVIYSSAASVLGSPGQGNYATANAWLDGLAWKRRFAGLPALSINWGPWTEGMADNEMIVKRLALQGITPLTVDEAHEAMHDLLSAGHVQTTILDVDWGRMRMGLGGEVPPLLEQLAPSRQRGRSAESELVEKLGKLNPGQRRQLLVTTIQHELQDILSTPAAPETDRPLIEMGLDSLMAVEFGMRLQKQLGDGFAIAPTMLFDHPTIDAISDHVLDLITDLAADEQPRPQSEPAEPASRHLEREDIAIIGMGCRFPGARGIDEFWENLINGVDAVREIPADRWDIEAFYSPEPEPGKMTAREGGFLEDIGDFDAAFFNISDQEACWIDPQHRLLLEVSWNALEDAGVPTQPLADSSVGVFMGIMSQDYAFLPRLTDVDVIEAFQGAGLAHSAGVGRISYVFGFEGPSLAIDTASSSSLVAVCQAVKSLQDGNCNLALAGGVNAILAPANSLLMSRAGLLSPDGRCKSFSAEADGFGRGEGCGVVVLKRLSDARRQGDRILAVIRGQSVSHNGFSGGLTSPSGRSQARVISQALDDAGIAPSQVQYLEAHGTGTEYGDPMELGAAAAVLGKGRSDQNRLLVGSVKANISHLEAAGGVSGLIKTVLAMHHGVIPRQLHFEQPSPHIPWGRLPLQMVTETMAWPDVPERLAGVTALGLSGTNAHVVLSATPATPLAKRPAGDYVAERPCQLLVLSARNDLALREMAGRYQRFLQAQPDTPLADLCHTAATGRRHFEQRAALVIQSPDQASRILESLHGELGSGRAGPDRPGDHASHAEVATRQAHCGKARSSPRLAWFFPPEGSDDLSGARELYRVEPVFRQQMDQFDALIGPSANAADDGLLKQWLTDASTEPMVPARNIRLFALQAGLARLWQSWGIEPDAVMGLGIGQYAAACVAGGMAWDDALRLVIERENVLACIEPSTVGQNGTPVNGSVAASVDDALDQFESLADTMNYFPPDRPLICSLSGTVVPVHRLLGGSYWRRHCEEPTGTETCWQTLSEMQCDAVLQLGPPTSETGWPAPESEAPVWIPAFDPQRNAVATSLDALGALYVQGLDPDFQAMDRPWPRSKISLPTYPFQRKRYWITELHQYA